MPSCLHSGLCARTFTRLYLRISATTPAVCAVRLFLHLFCCCVSAVQIVQNSLVWGQLQWLGFPKLASKQVPNNGYQVRNEEFLLRLEHRSMAAEMLYQAAGLHVRQDVKQATGLWGGAGGWPALMASLTRFH